MKKGLSIAGFFLLVLLLYFSLWPVPIDPVAWDAPPDRGLVDPFAPNDLLQIASGIDLGEFEGPEDATLGHDNFVYVTTSSGHIIRIRDRRVEEFAYVGGRPLGIEVASDGALIVANSYTGLQRVTMDAEVTTLYGGDQTCVFANNLAIGPDGVVYFTEASRKFPARIFGDTMDATLFDVMEHGGHGRVLAYDPATDQSDVLLDGLAYANGVAINETGDYLVVVEMNEYRVLKYWLAGPRAGKTDILLENLPGFGDNLKTGQNGRFWLGIAAPRKTIVDDLADKPWLRKVIVRLPKFIRPAAELSSHVIAFDGAGQVLINMQDTTARYATLTGVLETERNLYLTTLYGYTLPVIAKQDL